MKKIALVAVMMVGLCLVGCNGQKPLGSTITPTNPNQPTGPVK